MKTSDKIKLAERIRSIEGLNDEERSALLGLLNESKTYGLVWEDKPEAIEERLRTELPVLKEVKSKAIISDNADAPNHIIIEGDNLESLTTLAYTHEGKIDVIYIDPPYNTGKDDEFKYNDNYVDKEDSFRHSKWLSFLKKRIVIAKRLLSDNGVMFISIDDYSFAQLKLLCDEIFENSSNPDCWNFLGCLIWNKQHSQQQGVFKKYHEYIFAYAKRRKNIKNVLSLAEGIIEAGAMKKISIKNPASEFTFPAGTKFEAPDGTILSGTFGDSEKVTVVNGVFEALGGVTRYPVTLSAGWTQKKQMKSWFAGNETFDTKGQRIIEFYFNSTGKIKCRKERMVTTPPSLLPEFGMGSEQTEYLNDLLGVPNKFTNPKPKEMIKLFIEWFCPENGSVLDFFAGSGTTLDATMDLNSTDKGKRQCILCTNNENNICEEVTYERNKRVIQGYTKPNGEAVEGLHDNNLRYYRTAFVGRRRTPQNMRRLMLLASDMLCIKENLYTELDTFGELQTIENGFRYFAHGDKQMLVIYNEEAIYDIIDQLEQMTVAEPIIVYVFSPGNDAWNSEFVTVSEKVQLSALPSAIYNAYKRVLPKAKDISLTANAETDEVTTETAQSLFDDEEGGNE